MNEPELCSQCKERPVRSQVSVGELIAKVRFCEACWSEKVKLLKSGTLEQLAQAEYEKMMRDLQNGADPMKAWNERGKKDDQS